MNSAVLKKNCIAKARDRRATSAVGIADCDYLVAQQSAAADALKRAAERNVWASQ